VPDVNLSTVILNSEWLSCKKYWKTLSWMQTNLSCRLYFFI